MTAVPCPFGHSLFTKPTQHYELNTECKEGQQIDLEVAVAMIQELAEKLEAHVDYGFHRSDEL